jgi:hypothetical protein
MLSALKQNLETIPTKDKRATQRHNAQQLAELARSGLADSIELDPPSIEGVNAYSIVATSLYANFIEKTRMHNFENGGVQHGFRVSARLARWGMRSYKKYTQVTGESPDPEALGATLEASYDPLVTTFSSVPHDKNGVMESAFGLRRYDDTSYEDLPYRVVEDGNSETGIKIVPSPLSLMYVEREAGISYRANSSLTERCPAQGIMLQQVWRSTVRTCVRNEFLFSADLQD